MTRSPADTSSTARTDDARGDGVVVAMEHLKKYFGDHRVLEDINLVMNKGENLVILGQSGTGK